MTFNRMLSILLPYLLLLFVIFLLQRKMIYLPERHSLIWQQEQAEQLNLKLWPSTDNYLGLISGSIKTASKGTIIVFHGNAGSAINRIYYLQALEKLGYRVILAEYPGYGARNGAPSESALIANGVQTVKQALSNFGAPVFLWGESLGSGVVSGIVQTVQIPVKGIVLIAPFDSLSNIAQHHYWFFLAKWLIRDEFDNVKNLQNYSGSTAILLAEDDQIIPNKYSLNLFNSRLYRKRLWTFKGAGHNSLPLIPESSWWQEVMQFVAGQSGVSP
ncbi:MAG: alpha/beta fold hydrolase [Methylococcales bacterium]|nr:alpha/beta fold hydrolase [Methylococcales bacterium]